MHKKIMLFTSTLMSNPSANESKIGINAISELSIVINVFVSAKTVHVKSTNKLDHLSKITKNEIEAKKCKCPIYTTFDFKI
ncbi:hypothetical protein BLOT_002733, partial [Blomia tropicalis]